MYRWQSNEKKLILTKVDYTHLHIHTYTCITSVYKRLLSVWRGDFPSCFRLHEAFYFKSKGNFNFFRKIIINLFLFYFLKSSTKFIICVKNESWWDVIAYCLSSTYMISLNWYNVQKHTCWIKICSTIWCLKQQ